MSETTITIYQLMKNNFDFGMQDYEIFNEEYRPIINDSILNHFKWREICYTNVAKWKDRFNYKLDYLFRNKYNDLYKVKMKEFNPLYNIELIEEYEHDITSKDTSKTTGKDTNTDTATGFHSIFPNSQMVESDLEKVQFVDNGSREKNKGETLSESNGTADNNTKETYKKKTQGSSAGLPFSKAMLQFKTYIEKFNLEENLFKDLEVLFMSVY